MVGWFRTHHNETSTADIFVSGGFLKQVDSVYENRHNVSREIASEQNPPPTLTRTLVSVIASFMQTTYRS